MTRIPYEDLLGVPFRWGGEDPATGLDCWGLARVLCARAGRALPSVGALAGRADRELADCAGAAGDVAPALERVADGWKRAQPGDLLELAPHAPDAPPHVAVLVSLDPPVAAHIVICGSVCAVAPWRLERPGRPVVATWRAPLAEGRAA